MPWGGDDTTVDVDLADVGGELALVRVGLWSFPLLRLLSGAALTSTSTSFIMRHENGLNDDSDIYLLLNGKNSLSYPGCRQRRKCR